MNAPLTQAQSRQLAAATQPAAPVTMGFFDLSGFELMQRIAKAFSSSELVPKSYRNMFQKTDRNGNPVGKPEFNPNAEANCMIALDMAQRIGANPLMVMQNLYIVYGTPSWSSKFLVATINACGRYSSLRYEWKGNPGEQEYGCRAWAIEKGSGERLNGIWIDWKMVRSEKWDGKEGSKWKTMPDQMFIYRAAAFWQRAYAPELGMGLSTAEELHDIIDVHQGPDGKYAAEGQNTATSAAEPPKPELKLYSESEFNEKLPGWRNVVQTKRKTPEGLIATLTTKAQFTDEQLQILRGLGADDAPVKAAETAPQVDQQTGEILQATAPAQASIEPTFPPTVDPWVEDYDRQAPI